MMCSVRHSIIAYFVRLQQRMCVCGYVSIMRAIEIHLCKTHTNDTDAGFGWVCRRTDRSNRQLLLTGRLGGDETLIVRVTGKSVKKQRIGTSLAK